MLPEAGLGRGASSREVKEAKRTYQQTGTLTAADDLLSKYGISADYTPKLWVPRPAFRRKEAVSPIVDEDSPDEDSPQDVMSDKDSSQDPAQPPASEALKDDLPPERNEAPLAPSPFEPPAPAHKFIAHRRTFKWPTGKLPPDHEFVLVAPALALSEVPSPDDQPDNVDPTAVSESSCAEEGPEQERDIIYEKWVWPTGKVPPGHLIRLPSPPESPSMLVSSYASSVQVDVEEEAAENSPEEEPEETMVEAIDKVPKKKIFGLGTGYKARGATGRGSSALKWPTGQLPVEGEEWSSVVAEIDSQPDLDIAVPSEAEARRRLFGKGVGFVGRRNAPSFRGQKFPTGQWSPVPHEVPPSPVQDKRSSSASCSAESQRTALDVRLQLREQRAQRRRADLQYLMMCEGVGAYAPDAQQVALLVIHDDGGTAHHSLPDEVGAYAHDAQQVGDAGSPTSVRDPSCSEFLKMAALTRKGLPPIAGKSAAMLAISDIPGGGSYEYERDRLNIERMRRFQTADPRGRQATRHFKSQPITLAATSIYSGSDDEMILLDNMLE